MLPASLPDPAFPYLQYPLYLFFLLLPRRADRLYRRQFDLSGGLHSFIYLALEETRSNQSVAVIDNPLGYLPIFGNHG